MISVCMTTYNGEKYLREQLNSILPQLGEQDEVIISDDGSTDGTLDVVAAFCDKRIKVIEGPKAHSASKNFENAISHANGDFIFLSDQDDVWTDDKVKVMMGYLQQYACVVSDCYMTDENLNVQADSFRHAMGFKDGRLYNLFVRNSYSGSCMAFRKEVAEVAIPVPEGVLMHDIWLGNVAAFKFSMKFIPDKLIYFRRHGSTTSTAGRKSDNSIFKKLKARLTTAFALLKLD